MPCIIHGRVTYEMDKNLLCRVTDTLREAFAQIDKSGKGIVFVVDEADALAGVLTDGDLRRIMLAGGGLNESVQAHLKDGYVYALDTESIEDIKERFNEKIRIIPVVNRDRHVVNYYEYNERVHIPLAQPQLNGNEYSYLMDAFLSTWISSNGKYITQFEEKFSAYCGVKYGVAVSNGTTALHLALVALGIGQGDEVIVPDITFAATINSVLYTGATPVIVDIEKDSWCMDPEEVEKAVTDRTRAIIPVHIYGQPCDMEKICGIAARHGLKIVEDCAEAHGAEFNGKKVGSFGDISCFSFFGNKVITTGEGGMCVTDNPVLNDRMRILRDHGMSKTRKYYHEVVGFNYRMTNLQAAIGVAQVEKIDEILKWREALEIKYRDMLKEMKGIQLQENNLPGRKKIAWLVSVLVSEKKRDMFIEKLKEEGIDARPFFVPLSQMEIYKKYTFSNKNSLCIAPMGINLPTTFNVKDAELEKIKKAMEDLSVV